MTTLRDLQFGPPVDPRPLARLLFGAAPERLTVQPGAVLIAGGVILGVPGPPGEPGEVAATLPWSNITDRPETFTPTSYTHTQLQASNLWTIAHNLGYFPTVRVCTLGGLVFEAEEIHLSTNVLQLRLAVPFAGTARLI